MYLLPILLPLISSFIFLVGSKFIGRYLATRLGILPLVLGIFISFILFYEVQYLENTTFISIGNWVEFDILSITWGFIFDPLSCLLLLLILIITTIVLIYSLDYMANDPQLPKFLSQLSAFAFFMLVLVSSSNYLQMFIGWEGVGVCSFLLINFWSTRILANKSAIKAFVMNRVGDLAIIIALINIYLLFGSLDYKIVFALVPFVSESTQNFLFWEVRSLDLISFCLFLGGVGKSAQIGLHPWLPDAMEGPTPVSSLLHSATMVTAGVFLLARSSYILEYCPSILYIVAITGAITAIFSSIIGCFLFDIKKIIAYSTCSQLGYMFLACGLGLYPYAIFHLFQHAFFKALLFLSSGIIIHALNDEQDIRKMGVLNKVLPITYSFFFIGSLSLAGFPFLSGYFSKDPLIEFGLGSFIISYDYANWIAVFSAFFSGLYSFRLIYYVFGRYYPHGYKVSYSLLSNNSEYNYIQVVIPLVLLTLCSIFLGYFTKDWMIGLSTNFWRDSFYINPSNAFWADTEFNFNLIDIRQNIFICSFWGTTIGYLFFHLYHKYKLFVIDYLISLSSNSKGLLNDLNLLPSLKKNNSNYSSFFKLFFFKNNNIMPIIRNSLTTNSYNIFNNKQHIDLYYNVYAHLYKNSNSLPLLFLKIDPIVSLFNSHKFFISFNNANLNKLLSLYINFAPLIGLSYEKCFTYFFTRFALFKGFDLYLTIEKGVLEVFGAYGIISKGLRSFYLLEQYKLTSLSHQTFLTFIGYIFLIYTIIYLV